MMYLKLLYVILLTVFLTGILLVGCGPNKDLRTSQNDSARISLDPSNSKAAIVLGAASDAKGEPLWFADHESGDLTQYRENNTYGGSYDSHCERPPNGVVTLPEPVLKGSYSMKMTAPINAAKPGCRQFRYEESSLGHSLNANENPNPLYYSVWMYFPEDYTVLDWTNIIQFKSKTFDKNQNDAFWVIELDNRRKNGDMYLMLRYKGILPGPSRWKGPG